MYAHMPDYELVAMVEEIEADRVKKTNELRMEFEKAELEDNTAECDSVEAEINRLHGPIGLRIGSRTPPEIAISILAEVTAVKNKFPLDKVSDKAIGNFEACATN